MSTVTITIDGKEMSVRTGQTILQAAEEAGIDIPNLCYHPDLSIAGACRMCVVEVRGAKTLMAACSTPVAEGMNIRTNSETVVEARKMDLHLLLSNHPKDCLTCEKNGDCKLQEYAYAYGVRESMFEGEKTSYGVDDSNPFFERDLDKCILCAKCVRVCQEIQGTGAIGRIERGFEARVSPAFEEPLERSPCQFCGNCISVCPVGALTPKWSRGKGRAWDVKRVLTTCVYCGVGCGYYLHVHKGRVVGMSPADGAANKGWLCVKGRFGLDFIHNPDRLTTPLIRKNGEFVRTTWDEALNLVVEKFTALKREYGPDALGGFSSAKCTNEENYLMQKFMRGVIGTNNVDHCARLCHASTVAGLAAAFGSGAMTNSAEELEFADVVLVTGSNTTECHPVIGLYIKRALRRGAKLIVADPRRIELALKADIHLQQLPGTDVALFNGMMHVILSEGLHNAEFVRQRTEGFNEFSRSLQKYTPEHVSGITGVPANKIVSAARMYAQAGKASIVYSMGITQHSTGTDNVLAVANLAMLTGNVGRESTGVNPLRGQNNVQGACDMGALPNLYPGYQAAASPEVRARFEAAWGVRLPESVGLTVVEMVNAAGEGRIKGMYVMGENPMVSDPDINHVRECLGKLQFLVVQDLFLTETAKLAHVVLPAASFAEKEGTFTSTERRVQRVRKAVEPVGESRTDWEIICDLARRMDYPMSYASPAEIMEEIARVTPSYGGISYDRLEDGGLQWPCPTRDHPGTTFLHKDRFTRGLGKFAPVEFIPPAEVPDREYPLILTTGRILYHYHTGSMTRRSKALDEFRPEGFVEVNPATAAEHGIKEGDRVRVLSRRGQVDLKIQVTERTAPGVLFIPFHFAETPANALTNAALDPKAKIPELKVCAARLSRCD